jgi:DNA-binding transcriptional ArsR family regulator
VRGLAEAEADEYDEVFAALKHPVLRQILLFLEDRGEASFTEVQGAVSIEDTGLMSYHLKELAPLVEQSERGKYRLSEVGQAGVALFQRVERERQGTRVTVRSEMNKWLGETFVKSVLLVFLLGFTWSVPAVVDNLLSVQSFTGVSLFQLTGMFLVSFFWDRSGRCLVLCVLPALPLQRRQSEHQVHDAFCGGGCCGV